MHYSWPAFRCSWRHCCRYPARYRASSEYVVGYTCGTGISRNSASTFTNVKRQLLLSAVILLSRLTRVIAVSTTRDVLPVYCHSAHKWSLSPIRTGW